LYTSIKVISTTNS